MRRSLASCIVGLAALGCCLIPQAQTPAATPLETAFIAGIIDTVLVPAGTVLALELQDSLNSRYANKGDRINFKVASEVQSENRLAIPRQSGVDATVVAVKRAGLAQTKGELQLAFDRLVLPDGTSLPLAAKLTRVGRWNTSKRIALQGPSDRDAWQNLGWVGQRAVSTSALGAMTGGSEDAAMTMAAGAAAGALIGILEILLQRGPELDLPPGILFQIELTNPLEVPIAAAAGVQIALSGPQPPSPPPHTAEPLDESIPPALNMPEAPPDAGQLPNVEIVPRDTTPMAAHASAPPPHVSAPPPSDAPAAGTESPFKISVNVNLVIVEATVRDERGAIYIKLNREDFHVLEDGVEQEICHFSRDELPLAVALVIDRSGSVARVMNRLRRAAVETLSQLKRGDQVALFSFAEGVERIEGLTADRQIIADSIATILPGGGTNIRDALFEAAAYLGREAPERRHAIILISDNQETVDGRASESQVIRTALETESVIYGIRVEDRSSFDMTFVRPDPFWGNGSVTMITQETGGEIFDTNNVGSVEAAMQAAISRLKLRFTLGYQSTNQWLDGTFRRIDIRLDDRNSVNGGLTVYSRRGYYAAKAGEATFHAARTQNPPAETQILPSHNPPAAAPDPGKASSKSFTNDDILKLARAGFGEEVILETIRINECHFDTSADALLTLKNLGIGEKTILAILAADRIPAGSPALGKQRNASPDRMGLYLLKDGAYLPLEPEPVEWRSDFFSGTTVLGKRITTPLRVSLVTLQSVLRLSGKQEFLLVCPEGAAGIEYSLLRAEHNERNREFRTDFEVVTDGSLIALQGTGNNAVPLTAKRLGAGKFRFELPELGKGEYAFLPPTKGVSGKLYTFGVP